MGLIFLLFNVALSLDVTPLYVSPTIQCYKQGRVWRPVSAHPYDQLPNHLVAIALQLSFLSPIIQHYECKTVQEVHLQIIQLL